MRQEDGEIEAGREQEESKEGLSLFTRLGARRDPGEQEGDGQQRVGAQRGFALFRHRRPDELEAGALGPTHPDGQRRAAQGREQSVERTRRRCSTLPGVARARRDPRDRQRTDRRADSPGQVGQVRAPGSERCREGRRRDAQARTRGEVREGGDLGHADHGRKSQQESCGDGEGRRGLEQDEQVRCAVGEEALDRE